MLKNPASGDVRTPFGGALNRQGKHVGVWLLGVSLVVAIFAHDLSVELGVAGGVPYVMAVLATLWLPGSRVTVLWTLGCTALTVIGFLLSPSGGEMWKVILNRLYAVVAIGGTGTVIVIWKEAQALLQAIIDNSSAVIYAKDIEGRFMLVNRGFEELTALRREEIIGKTDHDLFPPEQAEAYRANDLLVLEQNQPIERDEQLTQKDGVRTYLSLKFPLRGNGHPKGVCGISTDITARVRAEQHRDQLLLDEQRARAAAEKAIRLRDEFLQIASHELRTPFTSLQLSVQALEKQLSTGVNNETAQTLLAITGRQLKHLNNLVDMLLDVSRIQAGRLELDREPVDLSELVADVVSQLGEVLAQSDTAVSMRAEQPVIGLWDAHRIEQVVINLLTNAIKFGQHKPVEISVTAEDGLARLVVTDHGIGMSPELQTQVFERFRRGVSSRNYGGLGLGLYITRTIVEAHGGRIRLSSQVGVGSTFCVELPLPSQPLAAPEPQAATKAT